MICQDKQQHKKSTKRMTPNKIKRVLLKNKPNWGTNLNNYSNKIDFIMEDNLWKKKRQKTILDWKNINLKQNMKIKNFLKKNQKEKRNEKIFDLNVLQKFDDPSYFTNWETKCSNHPNTHYKINQSNKIRKSKTIPKKSKNVDNSAILKNKTKILTNLLYKKLSFKKMKSQHKRKKVVSTKNTKSKNQILEKIKSLNFIVWKKFGSIHCKQI